MVVPLVGCAAGPRACRQQLVGLEKLVGREVEVADGAYKLLADGSTRGRFPCSVAVAKFVQQDEVGCCSKGHLSLVSLGRKGVVYWNELFDNVSAVSEVFPIESGHLPTESVAAADVVAAAARLHAGLCVMVSDGCVAGTGRQAVAAVYDVPTGLPLVVAKSDAISCCGESVDGRCCGDGVGRQATGQLEKLVHRAIWELVQRDEGTTTQASPWSQWQADRPMILVPVER
jgi:hypothetical protein